MIILSAISQREQVTQDELLMVYALHNISTVNWRFIVLAHCSKQYFCSTRAYQPIFALSSPHILVVLDVLYLFVLCGHFISPASVLLTSYIINVREYRRTMENPEKLATQGTQDEEKQNKYTTQDVQDTSTHKQTQTRQ